MSDPKMVENFNTAVDTVPAPEPKKFPSALQANVEASEAFKRTVKGEIARAITHGVARTEFDVSHAPKKAVKELEAELIELGYDASTGIRSTKGQYGSEYLKVNYND